MLEHRGISRPGFTLIELMLVLAIGVILAAIAAPRYSASLNRYRADGAAKRLAADLSLAQAHAKATSQSCSVKFATSPSGYVIEGLAASDGRGGGYAVVMSAEPYLATFKDVLFTNGEADDELKFDGFGQPDSGATIAITAGGVIRTVVVNASTGLVTVQ